MAQTSVENSIEPARVRYSRAFRPLSSWLLISVVLLAWDYHRKHASRTTLNFQVRIEGHTVSNPSAYVATVGKSRIGPGSIVPIGWRKLRVEMRDAEPFEQKLFVWYGQNQAADIDLQWSRGVLDLKIEPMAKSVRLVGPHHNFSLADSSGTTQEVPVGSYKVAAEFDHISEQVEVRVGRNETNAYVIKPNVGTVSLSSEPVGAQFRLSGAGRNPANSQGDVPAIIAGLPVGKYQLRVWRGDYSKELPIEVKKWETNPVNVVFQYGAVEIASEPAGATIFSGNSELGQTPKKLAELKPGAHQFRLEKAGFTAMEINVELIGTNTITVTTNLLSVRYAEAIANARREAAGLSPDYRQALANVELALKERPGDSDAVALKAELEVAAKEHDERVAQQRQRAELDGRRRAAAQAFERATAEIRQSDLFDTHHWEFPAQLEKVRTGLLRAFTLSSPNWVVDREMRVNAERALSP